MRRHITTIGFDADDTLWQNEQFFRLTEERFVALLGAHGESAEISGRLLEAERRNLAFYGYGIKGFVLSMIETAIEITRGEVKASVIGEILAAGREMVAHPVETLPDARETLAQLAGDHRLVVITKGDLFDQERKLAQSGLGDLFDGVEIVSDKTTEIYRRIFARHGDGPEHAMMVGNSLKSDILPALEAGAFAVHIPHELTWALEHAQEPVGAPRYRRIARLSALDELVRLIEAEAAAE